MHTATNSCTRPPRDRRQAVLSPRPSASVATLAGLLFFAASPASAFDDSATSRALGRTLMFVDDHDILYRSGTVRVLQPAKRHSDRPVVAQTKSWETAIGWTSVYRDPRSGKYQLWYQAYVGHRAGDKRFKCVVCYAESHDGLAFTKPELDLFPYKDSPKTNIVLIGDGGYGDRYCNSVLVEPGEKDPSRRYKMAYYDWKNDGDREYAGLCVAFSPDGIHWTKHRPGPLYRTAYGARGIQAPFTDEDGYRETPVPGKPVRKTWFYPLTMSDAVDVSIDPRRGEYVIYGKMWMDAPDGGAAWKHGMGRISSKDFLTWSQPEFLTGPDEHDPSDVEFHTSPVFFHNDRYLCLNQMFQRKLKGAIDIELMTSTDGFKWDRNFRSPFFLSRSAAGLFDSRSIFTNATPVVLEDEMRFYYGAYNQAPLDGVKSEPGERSGVGFASIPRDRFAGLRPAERSAQKTLKQPLENIGQITLKPLDLTGCKTLTLNADASRGTVRVEILNPQGYRLRGFSKEEADPIRGDNLKHPVSWTDHALSRLPPGRYMVRLHLDNATVYAVTFR